ncbi:MAG: HIT domain-containing protein [Acidobacteria bacterium]|nr:HIT domain-containing protein [Acidobacteriota bacterium]
MDTLFTPWRFEYLTAPNDQQECIFCVAAGSDDLQSTLTLRISDEVIVMMNRYPYTNGHLMVAPRQHVARLSDADQTTLHSLIRWTAAAQRILSDLYEADGFNIGMNLGRAAGAGFADHCHMHIVPRWEGDSNFMSVTARTRLVPEDLESTWQKLRPLFAEI